MHGETVKFVAALNFFTHASYFFYADRLQAQYGLLNFIFLLFIFNYTSLCHDLCIIFNAATVGPSRAVG